MRGYDIIKHIPFDLMVCDEGHRLKNTTIKTTSVCSKETSLDIKDLRFNKTFGKSN